MHHDDRELHRQLRSLSQTVPQARDGFSEFAIEQAMRHQKTPPFLPKSTLSWITIITASVTVMVLTGLLAVYG